MTEQQIAALDRYEKEVWTGLPSVDRTIEIPPLVLGIRVREMRALCPDSWPYEKILAAAIKWYNG